jgi:hypothetical protein
VHDGDEEESSENGNVKLFSLNVYHTGYLYENF